MKTTSKSTYFYNLPQKLIAQKPLEPRDSSRLLVYDRAKNKREHKHFFNIIEELNKGDVLVINTTKVMPARLYGKKESGAKIEILLLKKLELNVWEILLKPAKRVNVGTKIIFSKKLTGEVLQKLENSNIIMRFEVEGVFESVISEIGVAPLPHYIKEKLDDFERYQTVYAKELGSSAAPTAGLHFTNELLEKVKQKGVEIVEVVLNVGLGTFRPVTEDNILNHTMHSEYYAVSPEAAKAINLAKKEGKRVVALGTTTVRVLESAATKMGELESGSKETNIFIYPPYKFKIVDALITNFHLPESTLLMLVCAMCGVQNTLDIYKEAIAKEYRFFSFGDAMFIK